MGSEVGPAHLPQARLIKLPFRFRRPMFESASPRRFLRRRGHRHRHATARVSAGQPGVGPGAPRITSRKVAQIWIGAASRQASGPRSSRRSPTSRRARWRGGPRRRVLPWSSPAGATARWARRPRARRHGLPAGHFADGHLQQFRPLAAVAARSAAPPARCSRADGSGGWMSAWPTTSTISSKPRGWGSTRNSSRSARKSRCGNWSRLWQALKLAYQAEPTRIHFELDLPLSEAYQDGGDRRKPVAHPTLRRPGAASARWIFRRSCSSWPTPAITAADSRSRRCDAGRRAVERAHFPEFQQTASC